MAIPIAYICFGILVGAVLGQLNQTIFYYPLNDGIQDLKCCSSNTQLRVVEREQVVDEDGNPAIALYSDHGFLSHQQFGTTVNVAAANGEGEIVQVTVEVPSWFEFSRYGAEAGCTIIVEEKIESEEVVGVFGLDGGSVLVNDIQYAPEVQLYATSNGRVVVNGCTERAAIVIEESPKSSPVVALTGYYSSLQINATQGEVWLGLYQETELTFLGFTDGVMERINRVCGSFVCTPRSVLWPNFACEMVGSLQLPDIESTEAGEVSQNSASCISQGRVPLIDFIGIQSALENSFPNVCSSVQCVGRTPVPSPTPAPQDNITTDETPVDENMT